MQSPHDYLRLVARWRTVASKAGVPLRRLARADGHTLHYLRTPALADTGGIYMSAAIHGDEPAGSEALITWVEKNVRHLANLPLLLFPVLNPWGLINNMRANADGLDLNRLFHRDEQPVIHAIKRVIAQREFAVALMLHEDYDAEGCYIYEIKRDQPFWGEALLKTNMLMRLAFPHMQKHFGAIFTGLASNSRYSLGLLRWVMKNSLRDEDPADMEIK